MDEELIEKAAAYAVRHAATIGRSLGFGIHGIVKALQRENQPAETALKVLASTEPYLREREIYERLREVSVTKIGGCRVPQLIAWDDELFAIEMTLVKPPFVLDFAGAWLDWPPEFPDEVWAERTEKWSGEFGADWTQAQAVLAELEEFGIYMLDPSPSNIRFR